MLTFNGQVDVYQASAGTGKTTTLITNLIKYCKTNNIPSEQVAFVSFTKKAAEVARQRFAEATGTPISHLIHFRTIHSLCFRALHASRQQMMDKFKYAELRDEIGFNFNISPTDDVLNYAEFLDQQVVSAEQLARNNPEMFKSIAVNYSSERYVLYCALYDTYKKQNQYIDFTDLLQQYLEKGLSEDVQVACLDEMQDSTPLQWQVLLQAFSKASHIFIAGDAKQAIYSHLGGDPRILLQIRGEQHFLEESYRVPSKIQEFVLDRIVSDMSVKAIGDMYCKSVNKGGQVRHLSSLEEVGYLLKTSLDESWFLLCRNRVQRKQFQELCMAVGRNFEQEGKSFFTSRDVSEYIEHRLDEWDAQKIDYFEHCLAVGDLTKNPMLPIKPKVVISTIHGVKGDEADNVVVLSDISNLVYKAMHYDLDAEHRVFYVACTRAKSNLYIVDPTTSKAYSYIL